MSSSRSKLFYDDSKKELPVTMTLRLRRKVVFKYLKSENDGKCKICGQHFEYKEMEGDHIVPWHDGGKTEPKNLQMLCKHCNRTKSGK